MGKKIIKLRKEKLHEIVRSVIVETYNLEDLSELMEYFWIKPQVSNLKVDIFVDDGMSYKRNNHQLTLFVRNGYSRTVNEFLVFSVEEHPIILNSEIDYNISYNNIFDVQDFIQFNLQNLFSLANKEISHSQFLSSLKRSNFAIAEASNLLLEMATLRAEDSKLPMDIWLDEGATFTGHAPRLKFRASNEQRTTREFSSMLLTNPPTIENFPKHSPIKSKDIKKLEDFVIRNLELLLKLANNEIDYVNDFLPNMKL